MACNCNHNPCDHHKDPCKDPCKGPCDHPKKEKCKCPELKVRDGGDTLADSYRLSCEEFEALPQCAKEQAALSAAGQIPGCCPGIPVPCQSRSSCRTCCNPDGRCYWFPCQARNNFWPEFAHPRWLSCQALYCGNCGACNFDVGYAAANNDGDCSCRCE